MRRISTWLMNQSLARKLTGMSLAAGQPAIIIAAILIMVYDGLVSRQRLVRDTAMLAEVVASNSTAALAFGDAQAAQETLRAVSVNEHIVWAAVFLKDGTLFARYDRGRGADPALANSRAMQRTSPAPGAIPADPAAVRQRAARKRFVGDALLVTRPIVLASDAVGTVFVQSDLMDLRARAQRFAATIGLVLFATFWLALFLAYRLQRIISAPLAAPDRRHRGSRASRRYDLRAEKSGDDEIGELVDGFNEMLERDPAARCELLRSTRKQLEQTVEARTAELRTVEHRPACARDKAMEAQPRQERVPRQHEPRDPHADERHHRHDRAGARHRR